MDGGGTEVTAADGNTLVATNGKLMLISRAESNPGAQIDSIPALRLALGIGFSELKALRVTEAKGFWEVEGTTPDTLDTIRARFTSLTDRYPKEINIQRSGSTGVVSLSFRLPIKSPNLPSVERVYRSGNIVLIRNVYEFLELDEADPSSAAHFTWFQPGYRFVDQRVNPPAEFSYDELRRLNSGKPTMSLAELLSLSKSRSAKGRGPDFVSSDANSPSSIQVLFLIPIALVAAGSAWLFAKSRHRAG